MFLFFERSKVTFRGLTGHFCLAGHRLGTPALYFMRFIAFGSRSFTSSELAISQSFTTVVAPLIPCIICVLNVSICIAFLVGWTFQRRCQCARPHEKKQVSREANEWMNAPSTSRLWRRHCLSFSMRLCRWALISYLAISDWNSTWLHYPIWHVTRQRLMQESVPSVCMTAARLNEFGSSLLLSTHY